MAKLSYFFVIAASILCLQTAAEAQVRGQLCAKEGQICHVNGRADVYYGVYNSFFVRYDVQGSIYCNNQNFGDPAVGVKKACYVDYRGRDDRGRGPDRDRDRHDRDRRDRDRHDRDDRGRRDRGTWKYCAREDQVCHVPESTEVRYGVPGRWRTQSVRAGGVMCSNSQFGDPAVGLKKSCEYFSRY